MTLFLDIHFRHFSILSVTSFVFAGMVYTIPQSILYDMWYMGSQFPFSKNMEFPGGSERVNQLGFCWDFKPKKNS